MMFRKPNLQDIVEALCVMQVTADSPEDHAVRARAERVIRSIGYNIMSREATKMKYDDLLTQIEAIRMIYPGIDNEREKDSPF
jgi:hypothetical protein